MNEETHLYKFTVPAEAVYDADDAIYVTVESYYAEVVPRGCFQVHTHNYITPY